MTRSAKLLELAERGRNAASTSKPVAPPPKPDEYHCLECNRKLRREGSTAFFVCIGCELLWTLVGVHKHGCSWARETLPIWRGGK